MQKRLRKTGLAASIAILTLAVILAIGSTFSLFTSGDGNDITISSANVSVTSKIVGVKTLSLGETIDETLANDDGEIGKTELAFANLGKANIDGKDLKVTNMTPGDEAKVTIGINNESTVLIAYRLKVTVTYVRPEGTPDDVVIPDLSEVIVVTATQDEKELPEGWVKTNVAEEEIKDITVSILLPVEVGNEFQNGSAKVSFAIEAIQANAVPEEVATPEQLYLAIENGSEVTLKDDIVLDEEIEIKEGKTFTIDLAGNSLTTSEGTSITNNGNLTIIDSTKSGTQVIATSLTDEEDVGTLISANGVPAIINNGTMTIVGVDITADVHKSVGSVVTNNGTMTITGATISSTANNGGSAIKNAGNLTVIDCVIMGAPKDGSSWPSYAFNNSGTATITTTSVTSNHGAISATAGKLILNDASVTVNGIGGSSHAFYTENCEVVVNGGNYLHNGNIDGSLGYIMGGTTFTINDGFFSAVNGGYGFATYPGKLVVNGGTFENAFQNWGGPIIVYGGTFKFDPTKYVAEYYAATKNADGAYTVDVADGVFFVANDEELDAVIDAINTDSANWNKAVTVVMAAGEYSGTYTLKQWPQWTGVDAGNQGNAQTNVKFVGAEGTIFTGVLYVSGYGQGKSDFSNSENVKTVFSGVTFDAGMPEIDDGNDYLNLYIQKGADNVTFDNCTFTNATHINLGGSGTNGTGDIVFDGCEFNFGGNISGGPRTLTITDCNFVGGNNGFVSVQRGGNGNGIVNVTNTTVVVGEYGFRTNALAEITVTNSNFTITEADGMSALVYFRGDNSKANFIDCTYSSTTPVAYKAESYKATSTVTINGYKFVSTPDSLGSILGAGEKNVILGEGNFTLPGTTGEVTISGTTGSVVALATATANKITFKGVTVVAGSYMGVQHSDTVIFDNCVIKGSQFLYANKVVFNNCTVDLTETADYIWTYSAKDVEFNNCVFNTLGKAILIYHEGVDTVTNITVKGCTFNATACEDKAAIEIGSSIATKGHYTVTAENNTVDSNFTGEWRIKNSAGSNVTVNGTTYAWVADGLYKGADNTYYVYDANGLKAINDIMAKSNAGRGIVINLLSDIDFTGKTWTPVKSHIDWNNTLKEFNGNGHTISNFTVNGQAMFSIFANNADVVFKNVTFDNATVSTSGINAALIVGQTYNNLLLDNVDVKNSSITGAYKVATLVGTVYNESASAITLTVKDCDVDNCTVTSTQLDFMTCGLVAFVYVGNNDTVEFENTTISNTTLATTGSGGYNYHAFVYYNDQDTDDCFNEAEGVTVTNCTFENR